MWRTPEGNRVVVGREAALLRYCLLDLVGSLEEFEDEGFWTGVAQFDRLSPGQKIAMLHEVGAALLDPAVPIPAHTAVNEAAIAAVFGHLESLVQWELDLEPDSATVRALLLAACQEAGEGHPPPATSLDMDEWRLWIEIMADRILWDRDWEDDDLFLDRPPDRHPRPEAADGGYFTAIAPDPRPPEVVVIKMAIVRLCNGPA